MAVLKRYSDEEQQNIAAILGDIFGIENAGSKIRQGDWSLEGWGDEIELRVELVEFISRDQAEAILNARPLPEKPAARSGE